VQAALAATGGALERMPVSVLGAGGVARAVVVALRERCGPITIYARRAARGAALASAFGGRAARWEERVRYADGLLVNATPVGMWPAVDETPMPDEALRAGTLVFDTVYRPELTRLLRAAQARGGVAVSGVEMFLHQAAAQYRRWHGRAAGLDTLRGARPRA
jgi:3-dehydroquinate dehydratase/shikimate dehydrogenase